MNYHEKVIKDRIAQRQQIQESDLGPGLKEGIDRRLAARVQRDERRQRQIAAISGMHGKTNHYSDGEQFNPEIHQSVDGDPVINNDGSFRKKSNWKRASV